ncbi:MAG: spore coat protein U domain-containing protein [Telluria sp.]
MSQPKAKLLTRLIAVAVISSASAAASAADTTGTLTVNAILTSACEVSAGLIDFGSVVALASSADKAVVSSGFTVACTTGLAPTIASTTTRTMTDGGSASLPFNLSLTAGAAANNFPTTATPLGVTSDGTAKTIPVHAMISKAVFGLLPAGTYTTSVTVDVSY